jgi:hypothetical protein
LFSTRNIRPGGKPPCKSRAPSKRNYFAEQPARDAVKCRVRKRRGIVPASPRKKLRPDDYQLLVKRLRKIGRESVSSEAGRHGFLRYLDAVIRSVWKLSLSQRAELNRAISEEFLNRPPRKGASLLLTLIQASGPNKKDHSRWAKALEFVNSHRKKVERRGMNGVKTFIRENGGVAGCARKVATPQRQPRLKRDPADWE